MATLASWIRATRPLAQANLAIPLALGQASAYHEHGIFELRLALLIHLFGVADHLFIVFANDYADRHTDDGRTTLVSGGSGVLVEGRIRPESLRRAAIGAGLAASALTVPLVFARPWLVMAAPLALGLLHAYSYPPFDLSRRGGGEWLQALGVGVGLPGFAYYVQSGDALPPLTLLLPSFLLAFAGHVLTAVPDEDGDRRAGKRTIVVRLGSRRATSLAFLLVLAAVPMVAIASSTQPPSTWARGALLVATTVAAFVVPGRSNRRGPPSITSILLALGAVELVLLAYLAWLVGFDVP